MSRKELKAESVAEAYLALLAERGVEYLFANAGTDFAPIVEAYAKAAHTGFPAPKPLIATHENLALSMAHGYAVASGKVPAVMVHVSVGTANALCGVFNAARANVPILFTAGRSPLTEEGLAGARDTYIHWAQEMFDQAGMLREMVKWDYELRNGAQLETVVDRALTLATSPPEGPVYLSLPREVLAEKLAGFSYDSPARRVAASPPAPDEAALAAAAEILAQAQNPLVITADAGRDLAAVAALAEFAERFAVPVVEHRQRYLCLPADHPCHLGYNPGALLRDADAILVLECDVPWTPSREAPSAECKVVHIGVDPLFSRYPIRGFTCDVAITGATRLVLPRLGAALAGSADPTSDEMLPQAADGTRLPADATVAGPAPVSSSSASPPPPPTRPTVRPLAPDRYQIRFTASAETYQKLRQAQELLGHTMPSGDVAMTRPLNSRWTLVGPSLTWMEDATKNAAVNSATRGTSSSRTRHAPAQASSPATT